MSFGDARVTARTVSIVAAKIDADGDTTWAVALDTSADWAPLDVEADLAGGAFLAGADGRGVDVFVISLGADASVTWQKSFRAPRQDEEWLFDMTIAEEGLPVLLGHGFLAGGADPTATPPFFVAKLDALGALDWVVYRDEAATEIASEPDGELLQPARLEIALGSRQRFDPSAKAQTVVAPSRARKIRNASGADSGPEKARQDLQPWSKVWTVVARLVGEGASVPGAALSVRVPMRSTAAGRSNWYAHDTTSPCELRTVQPRACPDRAHPHDERVGAGCMREGRGSPDLEPAPRRS